VPTVLAGPATRRHPPSAHAATRTIRDVRGTGIAGLLGDLVASGEPVLAVCAHARHRAAALRERVGGFCVTTWAAIDDEPGLAAPYAHVVAIDPPAHAHLERLFTTLPGDGWAHLAWGGAERSFARRVHAWETDLRAPAASLYRALRAEGAAEGPALEALLRGDGTPERTGRLAGRLVRALAELGLVHVTQEPLRVTVAADPPRTELERSDAFRAYQRRLRDGMALLDDPGARRLDRQEEEVPRRAA
jgi:single-stranded-DNA-specific exonuclease